MKLTTKDDIQSELSVMIHKMFEIPLEDVKYDSMFFDDLGLDSLDAIDLIAQFQGKIGRRIAPEEFSEVRKVGDVVEIIERILLGNNSEQEIRAD